MRYEQKHLTNGRVVKVKVVDRIKTPWNCLYNLYEDVNGNSYFDVTDGELLIERGSREDLEDYINSTEN